MPNASRTGAQIQGAKSNLRSSQSAALTVVVAVVFAISSTLLQMSLGLGLALLTVGEGNGPINALDQALRKDLGIYRDLIADLAKAFPPGAAARRR